ncbi:TraM recognition domain-containing protein [Nocardia sp. MW-W600-9]
MYGREQVGRVWVCDLQAVTGQVVCGFWVNLFNQVTGLPAAPKLAGFFVSGSAGSANEIANAKTDAYFDGGAQELFALCVFAAACAGGDLHHSRGEWLGRDQDPTPALILRHYGHDRPAARIVECQGLYARQRDGLYDMARRFQRALRFRGTPRWSRPRFGSCSRSAKPPPSPTTASSRGGKVSSIRNGVLIESTEQARTHLLPEFDHVSFVTSNDTLYPLSMTGPDGATPLTAALVGQVLRSRSHLRRARPDGRLATPLLCVLDEAANCARVKANCSSYYTYSAGCGIILMTILQVLEQGENLWGVNGLEDHDGPRRSRSTAAPSPRATIWIISQRWPGNTTSPTAPAPTHPAGNPTQPVLARRTYSRCRDARRPAERPGLVRLGHGPVVSAKFPGSTASTRAAGAQVDATVRRWAGLCTGQVEPFGSGDQS